MAGEGAWTCMKDVLGWLIYTEAGMVDLLERKNLELLKLLSIPAIQRRMVRKELERLVEKLLPVHLAVPRALAHLYHIQRTLTQVGKDWAWILADFHW